MSDAGRDGRLAKLTRERDEALALPCLLESAEGNPRWGNVRDAIRVVKAARRERDKARAFAEACEKELRDYRFELEECRSWHADCARELLEWKVRAEKAELELRIRDLPQQTLERF